MAPLKQLAFEGMTKPTKTNPKLATFRFIVDITNSYPQLAKYQPRNILKAFTKWQCSQPLTSPYNPYKASFDPYPWMERQNVYKDLKSILDQELESIIEMVELYMPDYYEDFVSAVIGKEVKSGTNTS